MRYEITYHYKEQEDGIFGEDVKTKTIKIGTPDDDITLDVCAGKIIGQLARRNIEIVDVEIIEHSKKNLTFKQTDDGIMIGKRKFSYEDGPRLGNSVCEMESGTSQPAPVQPVQAGGPVEQLLALLLNNPGILGQIQGTGIQPHQAPISGGTGSVVQFKPTPVGKPLRFEIFNPVIPGLAQEAKRRGYAFTLGKKYPIYSESAASTENVHAGMNYVTVDDTGQRRVMNDKHFTPDVAKLERGFEGDSFKPASTPGSGDARLDWGSGVVDGAMPDIRR